MTAALAAVLLAAVLLAARVRRARERTLADLALAWGDPIDRRRRLDAMLTSHRARRAWEGGLALDDRTWSDLDLDAVFAMLDRTTSTLGQHALYHRLRAVPTGASPTAFDALTTRLASDAERRERAQLALLRLRDPQGYDLWWLGRADAVVTSRWYVLFPVLALSTALLVAAVPFQPALLPFLVAAFGLNVVVRYLTDSRIGAAALAFRQIAPVVTAADALRDVVADEVAPLVGSLERDAPRLQRLKNIARWVSGDPLMLPPDVDALSLLASDAVSVIYEYLNLLFLLDANGVYFGARLLREHADRLLRVAAAVGEVDAAISVASVRTGARAWVRPRFLEPGTAAQLDGVVHPLLAEAVPNSIALPPGRGVLVTGSNMSGKSTLLRTAGVAAVMAQTLHTCLAGSYEAPVFHVRSAIGRADDLLSGRSYYLAEVEALLALVSAAGSDAPHLFLLDELFRGTNAVERIAAGRAVLEELAGLRRGGPHVVIAATHDSELVDLLAGSYAAYHFGDDVGPDGLIFDHRLRPGPATTRNAIALLRQYGAPQRLLERALATAGDLDRQRGVGLEGR